jgi:hypothetical protein
VTSAINRHKIKTEITQNNTRRPTPRPKTGQKMKQMFTVLNFTESGIFHIVFFDVFHAKISTQNMKYVNDMAYPKIHCS